MTTRKPAKRPARAKKPSTAVDPAEPCTLRGLLDRSVKRMQAARLFFGHGSNNAYDEAAYLLLYALGLPPHELDAYLERKLDGVESAAAIGLIERRIAERVPAAYLTHEAWLLGHRFYVDERVLVPRSFIAELIEQGFKPWLTDENAPARVLDLCTGSGCLAILAALAFPEAQIDASDISPAALAVARRNIDDYQLAAQVDLLESDLFNGLGARRYDLIMSNPPYVDAPSMRGLPPEYRKEPQLALAAGKDGLDLVHRILRDATKHLTKNGFLVVEIGHNREVLEKHYPTLGFTWLEVSGGDQFVFLLEASELTAWSNRKPVH